MITNETLELMMWNYKPDGSLIHMMIWKSLSEELTVRGKTGWNKTAIKIIVMWQAHHECHPEHTSTNLTLRLLPNHNTCTYKHRGTFESQCTCTLYHMKYCLKSTKIITNTAEVIQKWLNCVAAVDILGSHYVQQSLCATALAENSFRIISIKMQVFMNLL